MGQADVVDDGGDREIWGLTGFLGFLCLVESRGCTQPGKELYFWVQVLLGVEVRYNPKRSLSQDR
jgi:hypothetical protein